MDKVDVKIGIAADYDDAGARQAERGLKGVELAARQAEQASAKAVQEAGRAPAEAGPGGGGALPQGQGPTEALREYRAVLLSLAEACDEALGALKRQVEAELAAAQAAEGSTVGADRQAQARLRGAAAAQAEGDRAAALTQAMRLESMGKRALIAELQRLAAARKAAAAAGQSDAYRQLTEQYRQAKAALEQLNTQGSLNRIALMGQAQAGLQFAQGLESLSSQVAQGSGNLAGMATQAMALGLALKAGLGPVGWMMAALQGLSMLWSHFSDGQKRATESMREAAAAAHDLQGSLRRLALENVARQAEAIEECTRREVAALQRREGAELASLQRRHEAAEAARQRELEGLRLSVAAQLAEQERLRALGQTPDAQLELFREEKGRELEVAERAARTAAAQEGALRARAAAETAKRSADAYRAQYERLRQEFGQLFNLSSGRNPQLEEFLRLVDRLSAVKEENARAIEVLNRQMEAEKAGEDDEARLAALRRERLRHERNIVEAERRLAEATHRAEMSQGAMLETARQQEVAYGLSTEGLLRYGAAVLARKDRAEEALEAAEAQQAAAQDALRAAQGRVSAEEEAAAEAERGRAAQRELREAHQREREREAAWAARQQEGYAEQERWLKAQMAGMREGSELYGRYAERLRQVSDLRREEVWKQKQLEGFAEQERWLKAQLAGMREGGVLWRQYAERLRTVQNALQQEAWAAKQQEGLAAQEAWLQGMISLSEAGSQAAEAWVKQLRAVRLKGVQEALQRLEGQFLLSGDYARQDGRTQAQIYAADRRALQQRQRVLEDLRATPEVDAATLRAINAKLQETQRQAAGLRRAMAASARAALQQVEAMRPQRLRAANRMAQSRLDALAQAYARMARQAARAASRGDGEAAGRYQRAMRRNALAQERAAGFSGQAAALHRQTVGQLQAIAQGTSQEERGLSAQQRRRRQIERALGEQQKSTQRAADEAARGSRAQARLTREVRRQAQGARGRAAAGRPQDVSRELAALQEVSRQGEGHLSELKSALEGLAAVVGRVSDAAEAAAATAAHAVSRQQKAIETLQKQIDRINRKL